MQRVLLSIIKQIAFYKLRIYKSDERFEIGIIFHNRYKW